MYCGLKTCSDCVKRSRNRDTVKAHEVTISVSIAQAVDPPKRVPQFRETYREGQRKRIYDNPLPEHHFHLEYQLLPGCGSGIHRTDVVTFGAVSKVFTEKDSRVVKCWNEDGLAYYGWRHKHTFKVTKEALLDLYHHTMEVRVWNSKDKLSARARYDQPKAFRLPATASKNEQHIGVESGDEGRTSPRPAYFVVINHTEVKVKRKRRLSKRVSLTALSEGSGDSDDPRAAITEDPSTSIPPDSPRKTLALAVPAIMEEREEQEGEAGRGGGLKSANVAVVQGGTEEEGMTVAVDTNRDHSSHPSHPGTLSLLPLTSVGTSSIQGLSRRKLKKLEAEAAEQAKEEREGVAVLTLRMADLFANSTSIFTKLPEPAKNLKGLEVGVALECQLMTEGLRRELNPTTITVDVARCLPSTPVSHEELQKRCDPVFVKYQFLGQLEHRTSGQPQATNITWAESRVILLGVLNRELLEEWLRGPPLVMEVHDRDRRIEVCQDPAVFGMESRDDLLGTHAFGTGLARSPEAMRGVARPWDPYGVARADLSELLLGQRMLEVTTPITCGPRGPPPGEESVGAGPMGRALPPALPPGDYLQSQSELTITVELTYPLTPILCPPTAPPLLILPRLGPSLASRQRTSPSIQLPSRAKTPTTETPSKMFRTKASATVSPPTRESGIDSVIKLQSRREVTCPRSPSHATLAHPSPKGSPAAKLLSPKPSSVRPQLSKLPSSQKLRHSKSSKAIEDPPPSKCPFGRIVYVVSATGEGHSLVRSILSLVNTINQEALGLQTLSHDVVQAALSTYKLTEDQISSGECDVVTGFHVEDWEQHVLVLEGLAEGGVGRLWAEQPHHPTQADCLRQVFFNSEYTFSERLYGTLDVDLSRIHLYQPLSELVRQSAVFIRDSIPQSCLRALLCLSELSGGLVVDGMRGVARNKLLPTAKEVIFLGQQFAVPAGFEMESGGQPSSSEDNSPSRPRTPMLEKRDHRREPWEPLELQNPEYLQHLHQRSRAPPKDFITTNILHTQALAEQSSQRRRDRRRARSLSEGALSQRKAEEAAPVHNYSIQTLNSTELAKARLRRELSENPAHRYTYCQHYHSMTVVPIDVEAEKRAKRLEAQRRWRTKEGFVYPGTPTARESNSLPQRPDPARVHDLKEPFVDGLLHSNTQKPSVERLRFGWEQWSQDFERYRPPPPHFGPPPPPTIHLGGASRTSELQQFLDKEQEEWRTKVVVKDTQFHALRRGIRTELSTSGLRASSQLDKLTGILKDPPQKYSLRQEGLHLGSIPALDVVHNPSVDSRLDVLVVERGEKEDEGRDGGAVVGYQPGPFEGQSLKLNTNVIPIRKQRTDSNQQLHSKDFRLYYHTPSFLYKRPTQRLGINKEEHDPQLEGEANQLHRQADDHEDPPQSTTETKKTAVEQPNEKSRHRGQCLEGCRPVHKEVTWNSTPHVHPTLIEQT